MRSILNKTSLGSKSGGRPPVAVEVAPAGILAASVSGSAETPVYAFVPLHPGALVPGIGEPNIRAADTISDSIRSALNLVSPRTRAVTLVLPDTVVRVFILDFDTLPGRAAEAMPILRFRLRKMVPFDVEHAGISYQVLSQDANEWRVLTVVIPGPILAEYEAAVRAAGYEPGVVLPSSLAALEAVNSMEAVLAANLSPIALTTSIANGSDLLLHRTIDLPEEPSLRLSEIRRGIAVAAAYFEDKLQAPARTIHYAGCYESSEFARWIDIPELEVVDLAPRAELGAATSLVMANIAGAAGALAGSS